MVRQDFRYLVLWLFLFGIIVIVFLQVLSGYNIKRLIEGNKSLLHELQVENDLRKLASDVLIVESDARGAVITGNPEHIKHIVQNRDTILHELALVKARLAVAAPQEIAKLEALINKKIRFNQTIISVLYEQGRPAAQALVATNQGKNLRDSILTVLTQLETSRQDDLTQIVGSIEATGHRARLWGLVITTMALTALVLAFWYITNQGRQQQRMIDALNISEQKSKDVAHIKEQFLANMSHEIRTPMNAILGFTNLLRRTQLTTTQRDYLQNIQSAGDNLLTLVNDILDLSKIEAGMMQLEETRFSLRSMISSVGAMFIQKMNEKGLAFDVHVDREVPDILVGDAVRLTQILVNLISNAVKFTEKGTISVHADMLNMQGNRVRLRFEVADTGIGIAPEKQAAVFERFQQAEAETTRRYGGSGLGLNIVRQLVELQHGTIQLSSQLNQGSVFTVEIPYLLPNEDQIFSDALAEQDEQVPLQEIKVLIAEDNPMNQHLIRHLMKSWNITHHIVENGMAAIEAIRQDNYSIVLMDIQMPEMDGYTATSIIRNELKVDVPIIAMTAHAMVGENEKCLQLGMDDYVSKPIKETVLYNMIARHAQHIHPNTAAHGLVKLEYLNQLSGNDPEFEKEILKQFLQQLPRELEQLITHIKDNNFDQVRRVAHSLKSTVGYVGLADELHPVLEKLERDAADERNDDFRENYNHVEQKCRLAITEVQAILQNGAI